ncbi:MAG: putative cytosol aminopeptidase [Candidatus Parcubacteria bacterium]
MIFITPKKPFPSAAAVLLVRSGANIVGHPFVKALASEDKKHFALAYQAFNPDVHPHRFVVLPSGKTFLLVAAGNAKTFNHRRAILAMRHVIAAAKAERISAIEIYLHDVETAKMRGAELAELFATQCELANFEFNRYKQPPKQGWASVETVVLHAKLAVPVLLRALAQGQVIGEEINKARTLANTPGGDMTPQKLADEAMKTGKEAGFLVEILGKKEMERLGMGGVLGVARGSDEPPRFIVMKYWGGQPRRPKGVGVPTKASGKNAPIVLVGKGVTFDTGGLNLKPEQGITEMHMDMSGGAAVIHIIASLARLKVKKNVIGLVPAVENMPSGSSYHPGDLLKTMSGKTIEVLNTDAEGRIILADALTYAKQYKPGLVIDVATLTGAAMSALGQRATALFTTKPALERTFRETGERTGDFVWPLPLWEEYEEEIKGTFGDVANLGKTRYGGAITGAMFLWQFVKDANGSAFRPGSGQSGHGPDWVHLDIAPRMTAIEGEWLAKGAAGASIALLVKFLRT